jgi:hypothetical protein
VVSPSKLTFTFPITSELKRLLQETRRRDGIPEAEQIRRGLRLWFQTKGFAFDEDGNLMSDLPESRDAKREASAAPRKRSVKKTTRA